LQVLQSDNVDRLASAAHGIREILKELPLCLDVDQSAHNESLGTKVRQIEDGWNKVTTGSGCHDSGTWRGEIDGPLGKFLARMQKFFAWVEQHMPRRKDEAAETLYALDPASGRLPGELEKLNVELWFRMRDFFVGIAHHGPEPSYEEFRRRLDELERFLLERLQPRTFADAETLDVLIVTGESND
jgi:hypothetical protein